MTYADITIRDRNPVKRWLQRRRFSDALEALTGIEQGKVPRVLDFGAGDGELVREMAARLAIEATVFEPTPYLMAEAREKLAGLPSVAFVESLDAVESGAFDYVFCLEVFEHLPEKELVRAIAEIRRLLRPEGLAVIGVPHELFLPALLKGVFRMVRRYGDFDARPANVFAALRGHPPSLRPLGEIGPGLSWHFDHLGFDHRVLERRLAKQFRLVRKRFSPFPVLGGALNSEIYFVLRKA